MAELGIKFTLMHEHRVAGISAKRNNSMGLFPIGEENKPKQGESEVELPQICGTMPRCFLFTSRSKGSVHAVLCIFFFYRGMGDQRFTISKARI